MAEDRQDNFTANLKARMNDLKLTREDLARVTSVDRAQVSRWLNGQTEPSANNLCALASKLLGDPDDLFKAPEEFNKKYRTAEITSWNSNEDTYDKFILERIKTAKNLKLAVLSRQKDSRYRNRPRELEDGDFRCRVKAKKLNYQTVEVFYSEERFVNALQDAYEFLEARAGRYEVKYFLKPPQDLPMMNLRIIDDEVFLFGAFTFANVDLELDVWEVSASHPLAKVLGQYWNSLWSKATQFTPLSKAEIAHNAKKIFGSLGIDDPRADSLIKQACDAVKS